MLHQDLLELSDYIQQVANKLRIDAGYSGSYTDGGSHALIDTVIAFRAGLDRSIPIIWEKYLEDWKKCKDPEYAEYQRLKKKFEE